MRSAHFSLVQSSVFTKVHTSHDSRVTRVAIERTRPALCKITTWRLVSGDSGDMLLYIRDILSPHPTDERPVSHMRSCLRSSCAFVLVTSHAPHSSMCESQLAVTKVE